MTKWELAEKFGWTFEYIDSLSVADWQDYRMIELGKNKARMEKNKARRK